MTKFDILCIGFQLFVLEMFHHLTFRAAPSYLERHLEQGMVLATPHQITWEILLLASCNNTNIPGNKTRFLCFLSNNSFRRLWMISMCWALYLCYSSMFTMSTIDVSATHSRSTACPLRHGEKVSQTPCVIVLPHHKPRKMVLLALSPCRSFHRPIVL